MVLETAKERNRLLRIGFSGQEIEQLYILLNDFMFLNVEWQNSAAVKKDY